MFKIENLTKKQTIIKNTLFWGAIAVFIAMVIHCGILLIIDIVNYDSYQTSFPVWATAVMAAYLYAIPLVLLVASFLIYYFVLKKKSNK